MNPWKEKREIGNAVLYLGDCLEILPVLDKVDAVITDPQYGIDHPCDFHARARDKLAVCNDYPDVHGDNKPFDPSHLLNLGLPMVLWGANHYSSRLPDSSGWLVWDKERPDDLDQATCELAWSNCVKGVRRFRHLWHGMMRASEKGESYHPTQKPAALMRWVLALRWLRDYQVILDPYMGCSPVGVACVDVNRRYIGIEIEPKYFEIACERIDQAQRQQRLFA